MPERENSRPIGKFMMALLVANFCVWIYFWIGFAQASYPYQRIGRNGHPSGAGFTLWHHSIGLGESGLIYPFFKNTRYIELPSFTVASLFFRLFDPQLASEAFFLGISTGGWFLIATMMASFYQWYLTGWAVEKLWRRWSSRLTPAPI